MTLRALLASACVLALPLLSQSQTMELARVQAAHASLRQAQNQDDRLALHGQLQSLWVEAAEAGQLMDVDWTSWNEAVVDLGDGPDRVVVYTWNVELDDRTQRYGGWVAQAAATRSWVHLDGLEPRPRGRPLGQQPHAPPRPLARRSCTTTGC